MSTFELEAQVYESRSYARYGIVFATIIGLIVIVLGLSGANWQAALIPFMIVAVASIFSSPKSRTVSVSVDRNVEIDGSPIPDSLVTGLDVIASPLSGAPFRQGYWILRLRTSTEVYLIATCGKLGTFGPLGVTDLPKKDFDALREKLEKRYGPARIAKL